MGFVGEIFLRPGEFYFGEKPTRIRTVLGSCVSVTVWHPGKRIGGICHFMLPTRGRRNGEPDGRYGDEAMALFMREIRKRGCHPSQFQVKLFGGGRMFNTGENKKIMFQHEEQAGCQDVPCRNGRAARILAKHHGFNVVAEDLGGNGHRQLVFDLGSGDVWVRRGGLVSFDKAAGEGA